MILIFANCLDFFRFVFPVLGRFWPFLAVFSPQDLKHRPPDHYFSLLDKFSSNPMAMTHFGDISAHPKI